MLSDGYVELLTDEIRTTIISDYEEYRDNGMTGESALRIYAKQFRDRIGAVGSITVWIDALAHACYRYYALKYLRGEQR